MTKRSGRALKDELASLATEGVDARFARIDTQPTSELVRLMNVADRSVPEAVDSERDRIVEAVDAITDRLRAGGRLIYVGAGTPGRLGILDASECPPTFGTDPDQVVGVIAGGKPAIVGAVEDAEDNDAAGAEDLRSLGIKAVDAVVGISASGRTPYVVGALRHARDTGALTVALACNRSSVIGSIALIAIEVEVGPEFVAGSTRLKAGTAQKLVLNMLSTLSMVKLGKTYGNLMVDLRATNEKLQLRSEATVMRVTGADSATAQAALLTAHGSVKEAILMLQGGIDHSDALAALKTSEGSLRSALQHTTPNVSKPLEAAGTGPEADS
ncbi:N-acetylmuramic acid 6-phosphate etherase [Arthrobacter sp. H5]|uniref:N-acetylmuramic acid 6-phosphate etherase n=1 Tax=Arthrobacter sp. H5 TaxID=1267973 RepID=UPI0004ADE6E6|nr:N-acetylmuramic acid 6-phosphate etherase [Arthrobacter sp. H5]